MAGGVWVYTASYDGSTFAIGTANIGTANINNVVANTITATSFTGNGFGLSGMVKDQVGLDQVDNTSDLEKPVSTAQQTALNLKANLATPTFTGSPKAPTATAGTNTTQLATTAFVQTAISTKANLASPTFTGTPAGPTPIEGTNTTQLATTAFVQTSINTRTEKLTIVSVSSATALQSGRRYVCSTSNGSYTLTLPLSGIPAGEQISVIFPESVKSNPITIDLNSALFEGSNTAVVVSIPTSITLEYLATDTSWICV